MSSTQMLMVFVLVWASAGCETADVYGACEDSIDALNRCTAETYAAMGAEGDYLDAGEQRASVQDEHSAESAEYFACVADFYDTEDCSAGIPTVGAACP